MRSLLAQLSPVPGATQTNARRAAEIVAGADVDLVVLPELWLSGYELDRVHESALELDSSELGALRRTAADAATAMVVGFPERRGSSVANAVALIDERGELAASTARCSCSDRSRRCSRQARSLWSPSSPGGA